MLLKCGVGDDSWKSPWTTRRRNQSILKEINPEYSLEGLMLKLKLQYFGHLIWRADSLEKTLMLGKIEGRRRREWQRMRWLGGITDLRDISLSKLWENAKDRETWLATIHKVAKSRTCLNDWTTATCYVNDPVSLNLVLLKGLCSRNQSEMIYFCASHQLFNILWCISLLHIWTMTFLYSFLFCLEFLIVFHFFSANQRKKCPYHIIILLTSSGTYLLHSFK